MTPIFCCGFECGVFISSGSGVPGYHFYGGSSASISTTTVRSGLRSGRINGTNIVDGFSTEAFAASSNITVFRFYIRFASLPSVTTSLGVSGSGNPGVFFNATDSKIYPGRYNAGAFLGTQGFSVTTGVWYRIDCRVNTSANPWAIDVSVDGTALTTYSPAIASQTSNAIYLGPVNSATVDMYYDDVIVSQTSGDYPIGGGYVNHFIPTSDGTHNVAGSNDFERSGTGTDILNSTTDAYLLIQKEPLVTTNTTYILLLAPPNATDYVECVFGNGTGVSTPTIAPRWVEAIVTFNEVTSGVNNIRLALNDNGTTSDIYNGDVGNTNVAHKGWSDPPSAATSWTLSSGNGNFLNLRIRCYTSDAAPDPTFISAMLEAEFQEIVSIPNKIYQTNQSVKRASYY